MQIDKSPDPAIGLTSADASRRLQLHGRHVVGASHVTPAWKIFLRQFTGLLVLLLIAAALVALAVGEWVDSVAIGMVVVLNGVLGFGAGMAGGNRADGAA